MQHDSITVNYQSKTMLYMTNVYITLLLIDLQLTQRTINVSTYR